MIDAEILLMNSISDFLSLIHWYFIILTEDSRGYKENLEYYKKASAFNFINIMTYKEDDDNDEDF